MPPAASAKRFLLPWRQGSAPTKVGKISEKTIMAKVLILDRSKSMRNTLRERLEYEGFSTEAVEDEAAASEMCRKIPFDVILSDTGCKVPDTGVPFIVLSAEASIDSAVEAVRSGARDYLTKPVDMNRLLRSIHRTIDDPAPEPAAAPARRARRAHAMHAEEIIGTSERIGQVRQLIDKVAPCDARVLITGENGTGKELVARWLHAKSPRSAAPFVEVNCAAIPSELIESELFGHERGAFTSAIKQRKGKFEQADGGTLFMDEIGDMSLAAQAKVLRALQESKISRVGSDKDIDVDVRVIAATNKNLREEIDKGNFREDLYHRIGVVVVRVPALRDRAGDIPELVGHFIRVISAEYNLPPKKIDPEALAALQAKPWTGNIRELRNVIERLLILSEEKITADDVKNYC
jgi:two-component system nitrogen regulation response regulator NtrX